MSFLSRLRWWLSPLGTEPAEQANRRSGVSTHPDTPETLRTPHRTLSGEQVTVDPAGVAIPPHVQGWYIRSAGPEMQKWATDPARASRDYWLKYRGCPIVYGTDPRFSAPDGPCFYCGEDHHHQNLEEPTK